MRIAIIILGIISLLFLSLKWDTFPPGDQTVPRKGSVLHPNGSHGESVMNDNTLFCPKCKQGDENVLASDNNSTRACRIHGIIPINL